MPAKFQTLSKALYTAFGGVVLIAGILSGHFLLALAIVGTMATLELLGRTEEAARNAPAPQDADWSPTTPAPQRAA